MYEVDLGFLLQGKFELIEFESSGRKHIHPSVEVAVAVEGSGVVVVKNPDGTVTRHQVKKGEAVHIVPGAGHWMEPDDDGLAMMVLYGAGNIDTPSP